MRRFPQSRRRWNGTHRLVGCALLLAACKSDSTGPGSVALVDVAPLTASLAVGLTVKLTATPKSASGAALPGRAITWLSSTPAFATVDSTGLVRALSPGQVTISATSEGQVGTSSVIVVPGPAAQLVFTAIPASAAAGTPFAPTLQVTARDAFGNTATAFTGTVTVAIVTNPGGGTLSGVAAVAATAGVATFPGLSINRSGIGYTLQATSATLTPASSSGLTIIPGAAARLFLTVQPSAVVAGAAISPPVQVTARDAFGNTATGFSANVTMALGANPGGGTLTGTTSAAATSGIATFGDLHLTKAGTGYTLVAAATGIASDTSATFDVGVGGVSASQSTLAASPGALVASGGSSAATITVTARDTFGNAIQGATVVLAATGTGNALTQPGAPTTSSGVASGSLSSTVAGSKVVSGNINGVAITQTATILVSPAGPSALRFTVEPATTTADAPIVPAMQVAVRDSFANLVTGFTGNLTLSIGTNPSAGTLSGTTTVAAANGVAIFSGLTIDKAGAGYRLVASSGTLTKDTSSAFDITVGGAVKLAFVQQPTATTGGVTIAPAVTVEIEDAGGNRVAGATTSITLAIGTNPKNGALSGTKTAAASNGLATFGTLAIDSAGSGYTLSASAAGLTGATSSPFDVSVGPATGLGVLVQPTGTTGGALIAPAVQIEIRDAGGNRVVGATSPITIALGNNPKGGHLSGTTALNATAGVASFGTLRIDSAGTGYTLVATSGGLVPATSGAFTVAVGAATKLAYLVPPSNATAGLVISPPVQVEVRDAGGNRVTSASNGVTLAFASNPGGGVLSGANPVSAVNGLATFSNLSIDKTGSGYTIQATAAGLTAVTSGVFNVTPGTPDHLAFFVQPSDAVAGATIAPAVQVEVEDAAGNRVATATTSVTVAILDNPNGGTLTGTAVVSAVSGLATFSGLSIDRAGTGYSLAASAASLSGGTSTDFDVSPGAASRVAFFVEPATATAGTAITAAVQVEIRDAFGNRVGTSTKTITIALAANPGSGTLSGTKSHAAVAGVATFGDLSIDNAASGYTLRASSSGLSPDTSLAFTVVPGAAAQLVFTAPPSSTTATAAITPAVQVSARDAEGNLATAFTGDVTVAIGANPGGGVLSGTQTVTAVGGVAVFSSLSIDKIGTGYTLTVAASGVTGATSGPFNITIGAAVRLAFAVQPTSTTGGTTIAPAVQVEIQDVGGNRVTTATNAITVGIGNNPNAGSLSGTKTVAATGGVAAFSDLSLDSAGVGYTLSAGASGLTAATSTTFTVAVGAATHLAFHVQPSNTSGGATLSPAVEVEVEDDGGNRVTSAGDNITVAIGTNPNGGALSGTLTVAATSGVAAFSDLSIDKTGTGYTLTAAASGRTGATSSPFNVLGGGAKKLALVQQPTSSTGGVSISPAITVEVEDAGGNLVSTATNSVTLAIGANPGGGALSGTKTVAAVNGVATFANLSIDSAATGYTLNATASGLTSATSSAFDISVGAAVKLGFEVQPTAATGGVTITPAVQVEVRDAGGNRITGATNSISVAIATNPNQGTLLGTGTVAAVGGVATFANLSIDSAGTGYRLSATASGLTGSTSSSFTITVGAASQLGFLVQPSDATAGIAISPAVKVEFRDAGGNRVTSAAGNVTVAFGANPGGGTLSGTKTLAAVSGVATFSNLSVDKAAGGYTLQATSGALTPATSLGFDVAADGVDATLSSLVAATDTIAQCSFSCVAGVHASLVTVTVKDQFGNLVGGAPVTVSAGGTGNGFTPGASGSTNGSGVFTTLFHSAVFESKAISATAGGTPITQTAAVAVMPVLVGAGDIADCNSIRDDATANQLDSIPGVVFADGDNAYGNGTAANFTDCYDPTWGRQKARTRPVVGNHEYDSSGTAAPYFAYFGAAAADPLGNGFGYYSYDLGAWHIVVLNSDSGVTSPTSNQLTWLQGDLAGRTNQCVLALWHRPVFTSGSSGGAGVKVRRLWQALENAGAEIVINGHDHLYERFAPQDSLGNATGAGIREFIAGTGGGESHSNYVNSPANVEASDAGNFSRGLLRLTLYPNAYRWEFLAAQGQGTYADSGTATCH